MSRGRPLAAEVSNRPAHGQLADEQAYVDYAYSCLDRMREKAKSLVGQSEDPDLEAALAHRVALLTDGGRALCFGRIDEEGGQSWHIGRRHVEDQASDPVVVEWRARVAVPFYRATVGEPLGLARRRQFVADRNKLLSMADDTFGATEASTDSRVRGGDALLAELDRARTGEMLDIVATIQAEQDEVIRAPLDGVLAVQGGPGTGKTAIGLHRAAYLLYAHPSLARAGVLVVGPNRIFLRYIALVLPSLGEESVVQTTWDDLVPGAKVSGFDGAEAERVKGDDRMAEVLKRALMSQRHPLGEHLEFRVGRRRLALGPQEVNEAVEAVATRRLPYQGGRAALRDRLLRMAHEHHVKAVGQLEASEVADVGRSVRTDPNFKAALDRVWPSVSPVALVRGLLSSPTQLAKAADQLLDSAEQALILKAGSGWTAGDLPLLDEARDLLSGPSHSYGHVVVDEAQDLSPMKLRMLARRCPIGSMTVLGDLAQGTGVWAHDAWEDVTTRLPQPNGTRQVVLTLGYRAPGQVLDLANRLLPVAAPGVVPTESVRAGRRAPRVIEVAEREMLTRAVAEVEALVGEGYGSVALVVPGELEHRASQALTVAGVPHGLAAVHGLGNQVTVVTANATRGLEFDAEVLVEPAIVIEDAPRGLRLLYVAMTRPLHQLSIVHSRPLPRPLAAAS